MKKLLFGLLFATSLFGSECYIKDAEKHRHNQELLQAIIQREDDSNLTNRINQIGAELLKSGFSVDAYAIPNRASYKCFALWEGGTIPVTFFVYVWPAEEGSNIHSHPISCAFTVLQGTLSQNTYELSAKNNVRLINSKTFQKGEGAIDDIKKPFIHQLTNKTAEPCLSLHAYGEGSAEKVMQTFIKTSAKHTY